MSWKSITALLAAIFAINLVLVTGSDPVLNSPLGGGVPSPDGTGEVKLLSCAVCTGSTLEECAKKETVQVCPPNSNDRACVVSVSLVLSKVFFEKKCTMKSSCPKTLSKECLAGKVSAGGACNFCCDGKDCNKGVPKPEFAEEKCSGYGSYGECSTKCGPGKMTRTRTCKKKLLGFTFMGHKLMIGDHTENQGSSSGTSFLPKAGDKDKIYTEHQDKDCEIRKCEPGENPKHPPHPHPTPQGQKGGSKSLLGSFTVVVLSAAVALLLRV